MDDDYRLVDNLMRMNELGYDFGEYEYGKHPHEAHGERALGFTRKAAWKLVGMLASGDSEGLIHLAKLIEIRKTIENPQRDQSKELAELAQDIATAAENKLAKTAVIQPPTVAEVLAVRAERLPINRQEEPTDTRRKLCDAGFGWLPKKWQRKTT